MDDAEIMPLVNALIALDNFLTDNAVLPSYHVYMVCQKTANPLPIQTSDTVPLTASVHAPNGPQALTNRPVASITAYPNPLMTDSRGIGKSTVAWTSYGTSRVEVHVNAPNGTMLAASGPGCFSQTIRGWPRAGMTFYLQNVSNGLPLTADNTLAKVTLTGYE